MAKKTGIKVTVKWGNKKTSNSIKLSSKKLEGALEELMKRDEWGKFEGQIGFSYKAKDKKITEVTLKPSYDILMPTWSGYSGSDKQCKTEWDRMYGALEKHEDGHRLIHLEALAKISDWLNNAEDLTEKDFKTKFKKMMDEGQKNQDKFDSSNGHGSQKGVELTIEPACSHG